MTWKAVRRLSSRWCRNVSGGNSEKSRLLGLDTELREARVVDEHVQGAMRGLGGRDERARLVAVGEIGHVRVHRRAGARSSAARCSIRSVVEVIVTLAPSRARSSAQAKPMPASLPQPGHERGAPIQAQGTRVAHGLG